MATAEQTRASIEAAFRLFDVDGDGSLSVDELQAVLSRPGGGAPLSNAEVQAVINEFDENGDGVLQIHEFARMWAPMLSDLEMAENVDAAVPPLPEDACSTASTASASTTPTTSVVTTPTSDAPGNGRARKPSNTVANKKKSLSNTMRDSFAKRGGANWKAMASKAPSFVKKSVKSGPQLAKNQKGSAAKTVLYDSSQVDIKGAPDERPSARGGAARTGPRRKSSGGSSSEPAEKLRSALELRKEVEAELAKSLALEERATLAMSENFERRLGKALVENGQAQAAMAGSKQALTELIRSWDKNGDGEISMIEFRQACRNSLKLKAHNDEIDGLFREFDADGSGKLDFQELKPALRSLHDAALACTSEVESLNQIVAECRRHVGQLSEAAEAMEEIERDEQTLADMHRSSDSASQRLAGAIVRRNLKLDDVVSHWPGVAHVPGEAPKVTRQQFLKGIKELKVECSVGDVAMWFDHETRTERSVKDSKNTLYLKAVIVEALRAYEAVQAELSEVTQGLAARRKQARTQQEKILQDRKAAQQEWQRAEAAAKQAAEARAAAEKAAKEAKLASFKRRKDLKQKEKDEFAARVVAKRTSWGGLEHPASAISPVPSARGGGGALEA